MSLEGKLAVVTGASRGIGRAIAEKLASSGCLIAGTATSESGADSISAYLTDAGFKGKGYCLDVSNRDSIESFLSAVVEDFKTVDVLVNNAGITKDNLLLRMKEPEWQEVINTNLNSVYYLSKGCLRGMTKARWGRIINISSVVGSTGNPGQSNYAATKAGIEGFTKSLAREVATRGITVNSIAPGFIETKMTGVLTDAQKDAILSSIPMQKLGQPEDIANAVTFLVSDSGNYITGETLHVNGGMHMA